MSEMIERVAKALESAWWKGGESKDGWVILASAAIAAMREPTPEMLRAAGSSFSRTEALWVWEVMIDEALK